VIIQENSNNLDWSRMEGLNRLGRILKRKFSGEEVGSLAVLLSLASEKGRVSYEEIEGERETKENLLLLVYNVRLLLPVRTSQVSKT